MTSLQHVSMLCSGQTTKKQIQLCCKQTYQLRRLKNKGAILVIAWSYLIMTNSYFGFVSESYTGLLAKFGLAAIGLTLPIAGWLSDVYFGRYKVIRFSLFMMWIAIMLVTVNSVVAQLVVNYEYISSYVHKTLMIISAIGIGGFQANLLQFGMDQLHDASTNEITSFITWYVWTYFVSGYSFEALACLQKILGKLVVSIYASTALVSMFLFHHYLVKEPVTQNPFKLVYNVGKYAIKNKYPRCRSAFTYCEDELPSRIDLGKRKYGGPFTTEQVEDVKTLFRVLDLVITSLVSFSFGGAFGSNMLITKLQSKLSVTSSAITEDYLCFHKLAVTKTFSYSAAIVIPLYEFLIYPMLYRCIETFESRKKLALGVVLQVVTVLSCMVLDIVNQHIHLENSNTTSVFAVGNGTLPTTVLDSRWTALPYFLNSMSNFMFGLGSVEFVASQAPYSVRGLIIGACYGMLFVSSLARITINICLTEKLPTWGTEFISSGFWHGLLQLLIDIIVGIMLVVALKWYKKRKRDDVLPNEHIFAERYYGGTDD